MRKFDLRIIWESQTDVVAQRCSVENVVWKISQNSQEKDQFRSFHFTQKDTPTELFCEFAVNFANFLGTQFL